jgi:hypothetical protein
MLHGLETVEAAISNGGATEEAIRRIMGETIERVTGKKPYDPSIAEFVDEWLAKQRGTVEGKCFIRYEQVLRDLKETLGSRSADPLRRINREVFTSHRDRLLAEGCSPATCNHAFKTWLTSSPMPAKTGSLNLISRNSRRSRPRSPAASGSPMNRCTYFECDPPIGEADKRKFGHSRDKRSDCVHAGGHRLAAHGSRFVRDWMSSCWPMKVNSTCRLKARTASVKSGPCAGCISSFVRLDRRLLQSVRSWSAATDRSQKIANTLA